jgi:hypothetical protein
MERETLAVSALRILIDDQKTFGRSIALLPSLFPIPAATFDRRLNHCRTCTPAAIATAAPNFSRAVH